MKINKCSWSECDRKPTKHFVTTGHTYRSCRGHYCKEHYIRVSERWENTGAYFNPKSHPPQAEAAWENYCVHHKKGEKMNRIEKLEEKIAALNKRVTEEDLDFRKNFSIIEDRLERLENIDLGKQLLKGEEHYLSPDEQSRIVVRRVEDIISTVKTLNSLNPIQRDAILDYLSKKSGVNKTQVQAVFKAGRQYLDRLVETRELKKEREGDGD